MAILAGFMVPHPPMIVPEVGRGSEKQVIETIKAYEKVAEEVAGIGPDTIIITSPHTVMYADYFHISPGSEAKGSFAHFGAPSVKFSEKYDEESESPTLQPPKTCARVRSAKKTRSSTTEPWYRFGLFAINTAAEKS